MQRLKEEKEQLQFDESTYSFKNFISKFRNSPKTKQDYSTWLKMYVKYCNHQDVRDRIKVAVNGNTDLLLFDNDTRKIQTIIKQFIDHLYKDRLSPSTVRCYYLAVKQFYQSNEITLNVVTRNVIDNTAYFHFIISILM